MPGIFNKINQLHIRRKLRNEMPKAELVLWRELKNKKLGKSSHFLNGSILRAEG